MKKLFILLSMLFVANTNISAQRLTSFKEYYHRSNTLWQEYYVLPDGTLHGPNKYYRRDGTLDVIVEYDFGESKSITSYYYDGSIHWHAEDIAYIGRNDLGDPFMYTCDRFKLYDIYGNLMCEHIHDGKNDEIYRYKDKAGTLVYNKSTGRVKYTSSNGNIYFDINKDGSINELKLDDFQYKNGIVELKDAITTDDIIEGRVYKMKQTKKIKLDCLQQSNICISPIEWESIYTEWYKGYNPNFFYYADEHFEYGLRINYPTPNISFDQHKVLSYILEHGKPITSPDKLIGIVCSLQLPSSKLYTTYKLNLIKSDSNNEIFKNDDGIELILNKGSNNFKSTINTPNYSGDIKATSTNDNIVVYTPHGKGIYINGNTRYEGDFIDGKFEGYGTYVNGSKTYKGQFIDGKLVGQGTYVHGATHYNGNFIAGKFDGQGTITRGKLTIRGTFAHGQLVEGNVEVANMGSYKSIKILEQGGIEVLFANGNSYVGQPTKDIFSELDGADDLRDLYKSKFFGVTMRTTHVLGKYTTASGNIYNGMFTNKALMANGNEVLISQFVEGTIDVATSTGRYVGEAKSSNFHGKGKLILKSGNSYEGNFANNVLDPKSAMVVCAKLVSGDSYEGEVLNGLLHGQGVIRCANGDYYEGRFNKGKFIGNGQVRVTDKKGMVYEGNVQNFKYEKYGKVKKVAKYGGKLPVESLSPGFIIY